MSYLEDIRSALNAAHARGFKNRGGVVRAEVDQYNVVRAYDAKGCLVMFCNINVWNDMRRSLGVSSLEPMPVHLEGAEEFYGIERRSTSSAPEKPCEQRRTNTALSPSTTATGLLQCWCTAGTGTSLRAESGLAAFEPDPITSGGGIEKRSTANQPAKP